MRDFMRDRLTYTPKGVCMHSEASPTSKSTSRHFRTAHLRPGRSRKIAFPAHRRRQPPGPAWPGEPLELESLSIPSGLKRPGVASTSAARSHERAPSGISRRVRKVAPAHRGPRVLHILAQRRRAPSRRTARGRHARLQLRLRALTGRAHAATPKRGNQGREACTGSCSMSESARSERSGAYGSERWSRTGGSK